MPCVSECKEKNVYINILRKILSISIFVLNKYSSRESISKLAIVLEKGNSSYIPVFHFDLCTLDLLQQYICWNPLQHCALINNYLYLGGNFVLFCNNNKHEMNFIPNKHELWRVIFNQFWNFRKGKREIEKREEREKFCVINVKYKEISWTVRKRRRRKKVTSRSTE